MFLTRAEQRVRITSPDLLATLFLTQPRRLVAFLAKRVHCWVIVKLLSTKMPGPSLQSCFPAREPPAFNWYNEIILSQVQDIELYKVFLCLVQLPQSNTKGQNVCAFKRQILATSFCPPPEAGKVLQEHLMFIKPLSPLTFNTG